jgi:aerobic-type carbon monoxide dehydrogenase small subunit (CoxS/CutS family)
MNDRFPIDLKVNGQRYTLDVPVSHTLLDFLRDDLGFTGTKECCVVGECGACTVIVDGRTVNSCLMLAVEADGCEVLTVEGLADGSRLSPLQKAFLDHGASQCGFCTPGQLMSAQGLLQRWPATCAAAPATSRSPKRSWPPPRRWADEPSEHRSVPAASRRRREGHRGPAVSGRHQDGRRPARQAGDARLRSRPHHLDRQDGRRGSRRRAPRDDSRRSPQADAPLRSLRQRPAGPGRR